MTDSVAESISKTLRRLAWATTVIYVVVIVAVVLVWRDGNRTTDALCELRANIARNVHASEVFLAENPKGIPGLPAATISKTLENQRHSLDALSTLSCPTVVFPPD